MHDARYHSTVNSLRTLRYVAIDRVEFFRWRNQSHDICALHTPNRNVSELSKHRCNTSISLTAKPDNSFTWQYVLTQRIRTEVSLHHETSHEKFRFIRDSQSFTD